MRRLVVILSLLAVTASGQSVARKMAMQNGLVPRNGMSSWWWPAVTEDATDFYSTYDGTLTGDAVATANEGFVLDGTGDYVSIGDNDRWTFGSGTAVTIAGWVRVDSTNANQSVISKYYNSVAAPEAEWFIRYRSDGRFQFQLFDADAGNRNGRITDSIAAEAGAGWFHFVCTYSGSGGSAGIRIWINGARRDATDNNAGTFVVIENTAQPLEIGGDSLVASPVYMDGKIDALMWWSRVLSDSEKVALYQFGRHTHAN